MRIVAVILAVLGMLSPLAWAESPQVGVEFAQASPVELPPYPEGDDNDPATLGHIRWLAEREDIRWNEHWRKMREFRDEMREPIRGTGEWKNTVILILGAIASVLIFVIGVLYRRRLEEYSPVGG